jgi:hypothetical protein
LDFETVYTELGIQPLPSNVERQERVQSRLAQLSRESCYRDAVVNLARAFLDAGYPREAATSLRSFVKRCGSAAEVFGSGIDGLLGMSFLSRFNVNLSPTGVELNAIALP